MAAMALPRARKAFGSTPQSDSDRASHKLFASSHIDSDLTRYHQSGSLTDGR